MKLIRTWGKIHKTEAAAKRKVARQYEYGWIDCSVVPVVLGGRTYWKVVGQPISRIAQELNGVVEGTNAPRTDNPKRRHASRYRF